ncbi:hypothetical protein FRD81_21900, partial [Mycobacterium tuberculosis]
HFELEARTTSLACGATPEDSSTEEAVAAHRARHQPGAPSCPGRPWDRDQLLRALGLRPPGHE